MGKVSALGSHKCCNELPGGSQGAAVCVSPENDHWSKMQNHEDLLRQSIREKRSFLGTGPVDPAHPEPLAVLSPDNSIATAGDMNAETSVTDIERTDLMQDSMAFQTKGLSSKRQPAKLQRGWELVGFCMGFPGIQNLLCHPVLERSWRSLTPVRSAILSLEQTLRPYGMNPQVAFTICLLSVRKWSVFRSVPKRFAWAGFGGSRKYHGKSDEKRSSVLLQGTGVLIAFQ